VLRAVRWARAGAVRADGREVGVRLALCAELCPELCVELRPGFCEISGVVSDVAVM